jgi:hypothetical protein
MMKAHVAHHENDSGIIKKKKTAEFLCKHHSMDLYGLVFFGKSTGKSLVFTPTKFAQSGSLRIST